MAFIYINAACGFGNNHTKHKNIVEPPITVKTIDCVYQRGCRKEAEQPTVC